LRAGHEPAVQAGASPFAFPCAPIVAERQCSAHAMLLHTQVVCLHYRQSCTVPQGGSSTSTHLTARPPAPLQKQKWAPAPVCASSATPPKSPGALAKHTRASARLTVRLYPPWNHRLTRCAALRRRAGLDTSRITRRCGVFSHWTLTRILIRTAYNGRCAGAWFHSLRVRSDEPRRSSTRDSLGV